MKAVTIIAGLILIWLQYALWFGQSGHFAQVRLQSQLQQHQSQVEVLRQRNRILTAEVVALKQDSAALEARARRDLGMVREGEVFYLVPEGSL